MTIDQDGSEGRSVCDIDGSFRQAEVADPNNSKRRNIVSTTPVVLKGLIDILGGENVLTRQYSRSFARGVCLKNIKARGGS